MSSSIDLILEAHTRDLGGFTVRRALPSARRRMVGPFIFFDHMGPAQIAPHQNMDVRPHPHIGLSTVTYLFAGKMFHRDSIGSVQVIEPGAVNLMTAGRGIVHSERAPEDVKESGGAIHGIQCWVALPLDKEDIAPQFSHHPSESLPRFKIGKTDLKLLAGHAFGRQSPTTSWSDLFYLEAKLPAGEIFTLDSEGREAAAYVVQGQVQMDDKDISESHLIIAKEGENLQIKALQDSHLMLFGGAPVGQRFIWWNLVSSSEQKIEAAKQDWMLGPRADSDRFKTIPGDDQEFIPAPKS